MKSKLKNLVVISLPAILFLVFWQWVVSGDKELQFLFASPVLVAKTFVSEVVGFEIWKDFGITAYETICGLLIGSVLGTIFGIAMWGNEKLEKISKPYIIILGSIPVFALAPMLIMWFGTGLVSKIVMAAFATFLVSVMQAYEGAKDAGTRYLKFAKTINAKSSDVAKKIIIPGSIRWVKLGFRMNISFALFGAFIGEFVSSNAGLGHYILKAGSLYDMPRVLCGIIMLSLTSGVFVFFANYLSSSARLKNSRSKLLR